MEPDLGRTHQLLSALAEYRLARERMLCVLGSRGSYRDPLSEFAEHLVAALLGGQLANSPVQRGWDLELPDGTKVQVKYLINKVDPSNGAWVNEHEVRMPPGVDWYALVVFEGFTVSGLIMFPANLAPVCAALGKKHRDQATTLQFGRRNWEAIRSGPDKFHQVGVRLLLPPFADST